MDDGHYTYGPEVDLDHEEVRDSHGNRVTPEYVEKALADVRMRTPRCARPK